MKIKSQRGSITIFVLVALLFYTGFLLLLYSNNLNKMIALSEKTDILQNIYNKNVNNESINEIYDKAIDIKGWEATDTGIKKGNITVQIGDKVNYEEGTGYSYTVDPDKGIGGNVGEKDNVTGKYSLVSKTFTTEDLTWRVLGVNEKGQLELISENPTTDRAYIANEEGYLYLKDNLNKFCNTLYGKGKGAESARSLTAEDINKLGNYDSTEYTGYDYTFLYRFPTEGTYMQSKVIQADGAVLSDWEDITEETYQTFRLPGKTETISKDNRNNEGISVIRQTYKYTISDYVKQTTKDEKEMSDLLLNGTGSTEIRQWLASTNSICYNQYAGFGAYIIYQGSVFGLGLYASYNFNNGGACAIRPVITLESDAKLVKDTTTDIWNIK